MLWDHKLIYLSNIATEGSHVIKYNFTKNPEKSESEYIIKMFNISDTYLQINKNGANVILNTSEAKAVIVFYSD